MPTAAYRRVYNLAEDQMGYVTTAQAAETGVRPMTLVMMSRRGTLERTSRGVYRLVDFPTYPLAQYMQATLWPYERPGVLSHETALALYEMSDADPAKMHITVPTRFRIQRQVPAYLIVHRADLGSSEVTAFERMPITTPERTLRDCIAADLGPALISQAVEDGLRSGRLSARTADELRSELRNELRNEHRQNAAAGAV
ncbi:MAG: type IV toxin-antitoxin system AbiEi family antitoxin domain-containing protein [Gemmatimonadaceae bacterium]